MTKNTRGPVNAANAAAVTASDAFDTARKTALATALAAHKAFAAARKSKTK